MAKPKLNVSRDQLRALLDADLRDQHMSQTALANTLGVTPQAISIWVMRAHIPQCHWFRLVEVLGEQSRIARLVNMAPTAAEIPDLQRRLHLTEQRAIQLQTQVRTFESQVQKLEHMVTQLLAGIQSPPPQSPGVANRLPV